MQQKLLEHSGKSPDPNEVAEEMSRDKGYSRLPEKDLEYSKNHSGAYSNMDMEQRSLPPGSYNSRCEVLSTEDGQPSKGKEKCYDGLQVFLHPFL